MCLSPVNTGNQSADRRAIVESRSPNIEKQKGFFFADQFFFFKNLSFLGRKNIFEIFETFGFLTIFEVFFLDFEVTIMYFLYFVLFFLENLFDILFKSFF